MTEKGDPLMGLVADTRQINRDRLAELLKGRVWLDLDTATVHIVPEERTEKGAKRAVLLALAGQKALSLLKPEKVVDAMSPKVLEEVTGLKGNTVRPLLKRLSEEGLIVRRTEGYAIHNAALHLVAGAITRKE
jgi:hypothetical protein